MINTRRTMMIPLLEQCQILTQNGILDGKTSAAMVREYVATGDWSALLGKLNSLSLREEQYEVHAMVMENIFQMIEGGNK